MSEESGQHPAANSGTERSRPNGFVRLLMAGSWLAVVATVVSVFADLNWIADILVQFRVQYVLILVIGLGITCWKRRLKTGMIFSAMLLVNIWPLIPYCIPVARPGPAESTEFRLLMLNVLRTNGDLQPIIDQIREERPDYLFLMEVHAEWHEVFDQLHDEYPFQKILAREDYAGIAFLSRLPWDSLEVYHSRDLALPSIDAVFPPGREGELPLRIIATHPIPPFGPRMTRERDQQLVDIADRLDNNTANLVAGDLNMTPWSPKFSRLLESAQLVDASRGYGLTPTLAPLPTLAGGLKVDHVLSSQEIETRDWRVARRAGSDHRAVIVDFVVSRNID